MRFLAVAFLLLALVCSYAILRDDSNGLIVKAINSVNPEATTKIKNVADQATNKVQDQAQLVKNKMDDILDENDKFAKEWKKRYSAQAKKMAAMIEKHKLDPQELSDLASDLSFEEFLTKVPANLRPEYKKFKKLMEEMHKKIIERDEIPEEFFGKYEVTPPQGMVDRREALRQVSISKKLQDFLESKEDKTQRHLNDQDVDFVLNECGKGNKDCIEKVFANLIDLHHGLSPDQLERIGENL